MGSKLVEPVSSDEERALDSEDSGTEDNLEAKFPQKEIPPPKASHTLTFYATTDNDVLMLSAREQAALKAPPGGGGGQGSPEKKQPPNSPKKPQLGPSKKGSKNTTKEPGPTKEERERCEAMISSYMMKLDSALDSPYGAISSSMKKKRALDSAMAAATGIGQRPMPTPYDYFTAARQTRQNDAKAGGSGDADQLDPGALAKMCDRDKQEMYKNLLMNPVRRLHPALAEKIVSMILQCTDDEVVRMIRDDDYLKAVGEKCIIDLHGSGYYDKAKEDEVFSVNNSAKPARRK